MPSREAQLPGDSVMMLGSGFQDCVVGLDAAAGDLDLEALVADLLEQLLALAGVDPRADPNGEA
jgi:hypothetical protein